jgi:hypothetical protein
MQIKGRKKTDRRGVAGLETHEEEVYSTCVGEKKAGQVVWLPEPSFVEEVIVLSNVITNLPAYFTTAAFLYVFECIFILLSYCYHTEA